MTMDINVKQKERKLCNNNIVRYGSIFELELRSTFDGASSAGLIDDDVTRCFNN